MSILQSRHIFCQMWRTILYGDDTRFDFEDEFGSEKDTCDSGNRHETVSIKIVDNNGDALPQYYRVN